MARWQVNATCWITQENLCNNICSPFAPGNTQWTPSYFWPKTTIAVSINVWISFKRRFDLEKWGNDQVHRWHWERWFHVLGVLSIFREFSVSPRQQTFFIAQVWLVTITTPFRWASSSVLVFYMLAHYHGFTKFALPVLFQLGPVKMSVWNMSNLVLKRQALKYHLDLHIVEYNV